MWRRELRTFEVAGLPTPERLGVVCTGSVGRDGDGFVPVEPGHLAAKLDAVRTDGVHRALLHPAVTGWRMTPADSSTSADRWNVKSPGDVPVVLDLAVAVGNRIATGSTPPSTESPIRTWTHYQAKAA